MKNPCWVVPLHGPSHVKDVSDEVRDELLKAFYGEYRIVCTSGNDIYMYVEDWVHREFETAEFNRAVTSIDPSCPSYKAYRPDGTQCVP